MKRFGSIFPFLEAGQSERHMGRLVANHDFAKAVLEFGDFDEFVFSNTSAANLRQFREAVDSWNLPGGRIDRVRCLGYADLPGVLRQEDFHTFHLGGWGSMMPGLHYIRARYARSPWPITAVTHSLNGREVIDHAVRLSHAGLAPHDAIFCTSRDGRDAMQRLLDGGAAIAGRRFAGQLVHLPLGIADDLLDLRGDRARGRTRLRIPPDAVVLLALGRVTPAQKMDLGPLCRVLARQVIPASPVPVVLLLAGAATQQDLALVKGLVDDHGLQAHVRVFPNFPLKDKADILAMSDILVSPVDNTQETFGLSLLEAMAAGLPVVASRFDGYKDLVEDGADGFLIDTWWSERDPVGEWFDLMDRDIAQLFQAQSVAIDPGQLGQRLLALVADPAARAAMGRAGRAKVDSTYRWSRVIARYEQAWTRLRAEAATCAISPATVNPYNLGSTSVFAGYASHRLTPDTLVRAAGTAVDETVYSETAPYLQPAVLQALMAGAADGITVAALVADLVAAAGVAESHAWFGVQWLMKYGLLEAGEAATTAAADPDADADALVAPAFESGTPGVVTVIGAGRGHVFNAIGRRSPATRIIAVEPEPAAARALASWDRWSAWQQSGRLQLLVGPDYDGASTAWKHLDGDADAPPLVVDPALASRAPDAVAAARSVIDRIVSGARSNASARKRFAGPYLLNTLRNVATIAAESSVAALDGLFPSTPAVIVGAGPSLDGSLGDVARAAARGAVVIALSTASRPLLAAGIAPHFIVSVDPGELAGRNLSDLPVGDATWLVCEGSTDGQAMPPFRGRTFFFNVSDHHPWPWLATLGVKQGRLKAWGGVMSCAFDLASKMGCHPVLFAGADLAFTGGRPYCRGTTYEANWAVCVAAGQTLPELWDQWADARYGTPTAGIGGAVSIAKPMMIAVRDWLLEETRQSPGRRFVNLGGHGILQGGAIECLPLDAALPPGSGANRRAQSKQIGQAWRRGCARDTAAVARATHAGAPDAATLAVWRGFASGTVTDEDIAAAITSGSAAPPPARSREQQAPATEQTLPGCPLQLPERVALLRAVMEDRAWPAWIPGSPVPVDDEGARTQARRVKARLEDAQALCAALERDDRSIGRRLPLVTETTQCVLAMTGRLEPGWAGSVAATLERHLAEALWLDPDAVAAARHLLRAAEDAMASAVCAGVH